MRNVLAYFVRYGAVRQTRATVASLQKMPQPIVTYEDDAKRVLNHQSPLRFNSTRKAHSRQPSRPARGYSQAAARRSLTQSAAVATSSAAKTSFMM